jgi:hypothetical protein
MKTYKELKEGFVQLNKDLRTPGFLPPGQKKPKLSLSQRISGAVAKRGGVERYDRYDKGSPKVKRDVIQKELEYYLTDRYGKPYKKLSKQEKDEVLDDLDDKFSHNTKTYKKGSLKIKNGVVK